MVVKLLVLYQQVSGTIFGSFDFDDALVGDPFRYQLNDFSTTEAAKCALGLMLRGETETDMMTVSALARNPESSNSPPP